ncbi:MAG: LysR family transcriptional regulator [Tolumonas sp.]|nr:LysR family transcriptional regulator [Tolumonas sp.]
MTLELRPSTARDRLLRNLDWNLLYLFITIIEEGGITAAAHKLALSQPSVSNGLKRLEEQLGVRLLLRRKGVFALTYQGRRVYEDVASVSRIIKKMADNFTLDDETISGAIQIAVASHVHSPAFDATLADFHQAYPKVTYNVSVLPSEEIIAAVATGTLKLGICTMQKEQAGLQFELIGYEQMAFYCGRTHPLYRQNEITPAHLSGLPYVSFESDQPAQGLHAISALRNKHGLWGDLIAVSPNDEEVRRLIMAGVGFGVLTVFGATPYVQRGDLWQLPPYDELPVVDIYLVSNTHQLLSQAETLFMQQLKKKAKQDLCAGYLSVAQSNSAGSQ